MFCTPAELQRIYNGFASDYDRDIAWLEHLAGLRKLRHEVCQRASGNILDLATGTGANFEFFPIDSAVTGIDLSSEMLKLAERRASVLKRTVKLQVMDAEHLDFSDESFDAVVSILSLCTIPHPANAIREMSRVCKLGGKILFLEHGPSSLSVLAFLQKVFIGDWHVRKFGCHWNREPETLVREAGLIPISHRRSFFGMLHVIEVTKK